MNEIFVSAAAAYRCKTKVRTHHDEIITTNAMVTFTTCFN